MGERVLCKHEVVGSIPSGSTIILALSPIGCLSAVLLALPRFALLERSLGLWTACSVFAWNRGSGAQRRQGQVAVARSGRAIAGQGEARCGREIK